MAQERRHLLGPDGKWLPIPCDDFNCIAARADTRAKVMELRDAAKEAVSVIVMLQLIANGVRPAKDTPERIEKLTHRLNAAVDLFDFE